MASSSRVDDFPARAKFLWESAHLHAHAAPEYSRHLVRELLRLARREEAQLPARVLQRLCSRCFTLLMPGFNSECTVAEKGRRCRAGKRPQKLRVRCGHCKHVSTFPLPPKEPSRSGRGEQLVAQAPGAASKRAPAAGTKRQPPASRPARNAPKRRAGAAAPAPAPAAGAPAPSFFGFDFVPLAP